MGTIKRTFANSLTGTGKLSATNLDSNIPAANIADASVTNVTALPESLGQAIKSVAGSPPAPVIGDIWYNNVLGVLQNYVTVAAAWSSGGNLATARRALWGAGTQTAGLAFGGYIGPTISAATEEYGGTSWASGGNLSTSRYHLAGTGTQTAGLAFGGMFPTGTKLSNTEEYNGTSWTGGGSLGTASYVLSGGGVQTAAFEFGGATPVAVTDATEEYDGSAWTAGGNYPSVINGAGSCGILTAGLGCGGYDPGGPSDTTAEYDGTAWTAVNNTLYAVNGGFATGTQTEAILSGGSPADIRSSSQTYDGTSWTASANLAVARYTPGGSSLSGTAALSFGGGGGAGQTPEGNNTATEEFTGTFNATRKVTTS
jgi:hypothetical protein